MGIKEGGISKRHAESVFYDTLVFCSYSFQTTFEEVLFKLGRVSEANIINNVRANISQSKLSEPETTVMACKTWPEASGGLRLSDITTTPTGGLLVGRIFIICITD